MADTKVSILFEAAFSNDGYATRADIIVHDGNGWKVMEVKSNLHDPEVPDELIDDQAYTVMVMKRSGVQVTSCSLLRLSRDFRKGMGIEKCLVKRRPPQQSNNECKTFHPVGMRS